MVKLNSACTTSSTAVQNRKNCTERTAFLDSVTRIYSYIFDRRDSAITQTLPFAESSLGDETNTSILNLTIDYIISTKSFEEHCLSTTDTRQDTC